MKASVWTLLLLIVLPGAALSGSSAYLFYSEVSSSLAGFMASAPYRLSLIDCLDTSPKRL